MKRTSVVILACIVLLGLLLRGSEVFSHNFLFLKDQGRDMLAVKSIVIDKKMTLIGPYTGLRSVYQGPMYYYLLALPFLLTHGNPLGGMYVLLFVSLSAIVIGYYIGNLIGGGITGLFVAFIFAASPALSAAATFVWSPFFLVPIVSAYLYYFIRWSKSGDRRSFMFLALCLGFMYHFELAFALPWTVVTYSLVWWVARRKNIPWYPVSLTIILLCFVSPLLLFDFRHDHLTSRSLLQLVLGHTQGLGDTTLPFAQIFRDHVTSFVANSNALLVNGQPLAGAVSLMLLGVGIWYGLYGKRYEIKALFLMPVLLFTMYSFFPFQIWSWYLVGLFPVFAVLLGMIFTRLMQSHLGKIIVSVLLVVVVFFSIIKIVTLYTHYDYGGTAKIQGKSDAIEAIYRDTGGKPFSLFIFTPVVLTDAYDYLLWWRGQGRYGYLPKDEKQGLVYLLIEPDPSKPWSHNGWLETVVGYGGTIIGTETLPSGFIIQKRMYE